MLLKSYGSDKEIWNIAKEFKDIKRMESFVPYFNSETGHDLRVSKYLPDISVLKYFLQIELKQVLGVYSQPVFCGFPMQMMPTESGHAIIIAGYNENDVFIHDPNGSFITDYNQVFPDNAIPKSHERLAQIQVPWVKFIDYLFLTFIFENND